MPGSDRTAFHRDLVPLLESRAGVDPGLLAEAFAALERELAARGDIDWAAIAYCRLRGFTPECSIVRGVSIAGLAAVEPPGAPDPCRTLLDRLEAKGVFMLEILAARHGHAFGHVCWSEGDKDAGFLRVPAAGADILRCLTPRHRNPGRALAAQLAPALATLRDGERIRFPRNAATGHAAMRAEEVLAGCDALRAWAVDPSFSPVLERRDDTVLLYEHPARPVPLAVLTGPRTA